MSLQKASSSRSQPLSPGMRVLCRDAEWLIKRVSASNQSGTHQAIHCVGVDDLVRGHEAIFLTQLDTLEPIDPRKTQLIADDSRGYRRAKLLLEARLRQMPATGMAPDFDRMGVFRPMRFQEETVERALRQVRPRLLLADSVGLGKTIQVGMILTELIRRGRGDRILVLAKKSMLNQLQSELWNRFAVPLVRLDSEGIAKLRLRIPANRNPFEVYHRVIISLDTLKNVGHYRHFLEDTRWDCVVIDEAHNVAGASVPSKNLSYRLARLLSRRAESMLLTTATPHNGKKETFGRLISLLDPSSLPDPDYKEYEASDIAQFFFMRFKEDVKDDAGETLTDRVLTPLDQTTVEATANEEKVYSILSDMRHAVQEGEVGGGRGTGRTLLAYGFYKQFLSSPESCLKTVRGRLERVKREEPGSAEIGWLERLGGAVEPLALVRTARFELLKRQLDEMGWDGTPGSPRVLIFTEYRETQDALVEAIAAAYKIKRSKKFEDQPEQILAFMHGTMPDTALNKTVEAFGTGQKPMRMLIATDVASEGINLHHECHQIVHYDLPWSIITLVQRNGRIDRIGQTKNPVLRYLRVRTRQDDLAGDEKIFSRLVEKVEEVNRSTRQGESVLKLYDPEAEERYIAMKGVVAGNAEILEKAATEATAEASDLEQILRAAQALFGGEGAGTQEEGEKAEARKKTGDGAGPLPSSGQLSERPLRLYPDQAYFLDGYRFLSEREPETHLPLEEAGPLYGLTPPPDLRRRLGGPGGEVDVIFGATSIPAESWPADDRFFFSDQVHRVEDAIKSARRQSGHWSREHLLVNHHPVMSWITEKLLMGLPRGSCPLVLSRSLSEGDLCFCFIGQVSTVGGAPLVVDPHAVVFHRGGSSEILGLKESLDRAGFHGLVNDGTPARGEAAQHLLPAAVEASLEHLRGRERQRVVELRPILQEEERRLGKWRNRRRQILEERISKLGENHKKSLQYRRELDEMEAYHDERRNAWRQALKETAPEPSTELVLVLEGRS